MDKIIQNLDLSAKGIWFPITLGTIVFIYMIFMPKRLSWREICFIFGTIGYVAIIIDVFIMLNYLDVFDLGRDPKQEGIGDLISYGIIPSCYAVIFLNYYKQEKKWIYVTLFTIMSFLSEWMLVQVGYMKLKGWHTWLSIPVFIIVFGFWLPWQLKLIRKPT
jgi:phosphatidylserine synthase